MYNIDSEKIERLLRESVYRNITFYDADDTDNVLTSELLVIGQDIYKQNVPGTPTYILAGSSAFDNCDDITKDFLENSSVTVITIDGFDHNDEKYSEYYDFLKDINYDFDNDHSLILVLNDQLENPLIGTY